MTREIARLLRAARASAEEIDTGSAEDTLARARETEALLDELRDAAREGVEVVRWSPFRHRRREDMRSIAEVVGPLDRAIRNTRVLIRRIAVSARLDETMPADYLALLDRIADAEDAIGDRLAANDPPYAVQDQLIEIARATSQASSPLTLSAAVVLGQIRSLLVDLIELSGMTRPRRRPRCRLASVDQPGPPIAATARVLGPRSPGIRLATVALD